MNSFSSATQKSRVLVISPDPDTLAFVKSTLSAISHYEIVSVLLKDFKALSNTDPTSFDLVIFDVHEGEFLRQPELSALRNKVSENPFIFVSDDLTDENIRLLFQLNGSDWLHKPIQRRALLDSVNSHIQVAKSHGGLVHAVVSAGSGAGGTTVSLSLAAHLATGSKRVKPHAALFDLDFSAADCGTYVNLSNPYNLQSVLENPQRVDIEFIDIVRKQHDSGFSLFSFHKPELTLSPNASELVLRMLDIIAFQNDHTVLDIPYYETPWRETVLASVNSVAIVTTTTIPALQAAKDAKKRIAEIRGESRTVQIVVNKAHRSGMFGSELGSSDIKKIFKEDTFTFIRDEWDTMTSALNRGILPHDVNARSKFGLQVGRIAETLRSMG
ncbi:helicase/secretion neighborhood CpaE-like protein [Roseibium album]|nr:helicase/secretion neighborhood CpaE-like protein [Roseibium album]